MINDIYKLNELCNLFNINIAADIVSSVGFYDFDLQKLNKVILLGYSTNKCIGIYPGLAINICKTELFNNMNNNISYLNLKNYYDFYLLNETPYTTCYQNYYYYYAAIENLLINIKDIKANYVIHKNYLKNELK
jgi:aspartate aminotransferase-like enzyme